VTRADMSIVSYLSGRVFPELMGKEIGEPSDLEIRMLVKKLPPSELRLLCHGPQGRTFRHAVDLVLKRIEKPSAVQVTKLTR
jgi:hypothetical protein